MTVSGNNVQFYDFNLPAGGSQWLPVEGAYYRIISCTGAVAIKEDVGTTVGPINAGQGMKNRDFKGLTISDKSGAANKGVLIIAGSDFVDDRITGEVSTIDGGKARSVAGSAFAVSGSLTNGGTSYLAMQLYNGSTSTNLIVNAVQMGMGTAGLAVLAITANPLNTTLVGAGFSKKYGGTNGAYTSAAGSLKTQASGSSFLVAGQALKSILLPASQTYETRFTEPIVLPPGMGLGMYTVVNNIASVVSGFEWFEEAA